MSTIAAMTIAGSDSGGGAGIQADLKTFAALGVYGTSAITAVTAQNTRAVTAIHAVPPDIVKTQVTAVLADIPIRAVKIGMLGTANVVSAVAEAITDFSGAIVLDPVMIAKSGDALLQDDAVDALLRQLLPRSRLLTPNLLEAARLLSCAPACGRVDATQQGERLLALGAGAVLMKGGHSDGPVCEDILVTKSNVAVFTAPRINTKNTHGTGCTLSSAIAAELAKGKPLLEAVSLAHRWLHAAIAAADGLHIGSGNGPVHHLHEIWTCK